MEAACCNIFTCEMCGMCGMSLFFTIYIYLRQKNPDEIVDFCEESGCRIRNPTKKTGLAERCGTMSNFHGEAPGNRGEATNFCGEATNFHGAMSNFRGEAPGNRGEATNFCGEAPGDHGEATNIKLSRLSVLSQHHLAHTDEE